MSRHHDRDDRRYLRRLHCAERTRAQRLTRRAAILSYLSGDL